MLFAGWEAARATPAIETLLNMASRTPRRSTPTAGRPTGRQAGERLIVTVTAPDGAAAASRGLGTWLSGAAPARARGEVTVALVSDGRMRALNRSFRGKDYATDVLSFPAGTGTVEPADRYLGDIVIATGVARRQADDARHAVGTELRVLALHGLLHLLGYDHERDGGAMARTEERLRRRAGLAAGLIARSRPRR
jgi:probable rRNA maturation factor